MLTRTPVPASSIAADFVMPSTSVLAADIDCCGRPPTLPYEDEMLTMLLCPAEAWPESLLHGQKHTKHIRVENGLIALGGNIGSRPGVPTVPSVIDGNIESTETSDDLVDKGLDFLFMPHVGAHKFGLSAELSQFLGYASDFIVVSTGNNDTCSITREGQGGGATDSCQCTGD